MISEQSCVHFDFPVAPHSATLLFRFSQRSSGNNNDNTTSRSMRLKQLNKSLRLFFALMLGSCPFALPGTKL